MKKVSAIIAMATIMTIGGVQATFNYAQGDAASVSDTLSPSIESAVLESKKGTIKVYEPLLVTKRLGNIKLHKEEFNLNTKIKEGSLLIASAPCKVTLDIIRKANEENLEFFIALCGCCHEDFINYKDWINYVFDFANNGIKNESKIYKDSLDDIYNYPFPIIYKKCPKRY